MSDERVLLAHGSGGKLSHELIEKVFLPYFGNPTLSAMDDAAALTFDSLFTAAHQKRRTGTKLAFTTDSYVVKPLSFAGGDIGRLAVCGTVNDLSMIGAQPIYLTSGFIIEEGLRIDTLISFVESMMITAEEAGVRVVAGDTKVVEKGGADGLFINTSGLGLIPPGIHLSGHNAKEGDVVIVSGYIGDHGIAVLSRREGLEYGTDIQSDVAPLNHLVEAMLAASDNVHVLRDPTRGGLGTTLNEIAQQSQIGIRIHEEQIPIREGVAAACELLGYDPLYVANEGKLIAFVAKEDAEKVLRAMQQQRYGQNAAIVGEVIAEPKGKVLMKTAIGGTRVVTMLLGEMLPRIC